MLTFVTLLSATLVAQTIDKKQEEKQFKEQEKQQKKEHKRREQLAAVSVPFVGIKAPADKIKAAILARIGQWGGFTLVGDSQYQLKFQRVARWPNAWAALSMESTSSRPTKEGLAFTFVESDGKTQISTDRSVTRESNYGNTQTDPANNIGKWNLELQEFLDAVRDDLEKQAPAQTESVPERSHRLD
jgi:hypothetical protein